jgi:ADP-ribose pyrophosphatase
MEQKLSLAEQQQKKERKAALKSQRLYEGKILSLRLDTLSFEENIHSHREYIEHRGGVGLVAIDAENNFLLVEQYRRPADEILLEIPAGLLEIGDEPKTRAQLELQEETGYRAQRLISLGGFFASPGFCNEYMHLFLALDLQKAPLPCDEEEAIDLKRLSASELFEKIALHQIKDLKTIAAIFLYLRWKDSQGKKMP